MLVDLEPEQQRVIDLAIQSGAFHNTNEVIATALSMLAEDIEDGIVSEAQSHEPRFALAEVEAELRAPLREDAKCPRCEITARLFIDPPGTVGHWQPPSADSNS
jgi:Arc/MetJ-type ribon-helix-helix transcriptional regulator